MYIRTNHNFFGTFGVTYQDLQNLCVQINQAVSGAPPQAQNAIQAILARRTPFNMPGFDTVKNLTAKLMGYNPPAGFYAQDLQVLQSALSDIKTATQAAIQAQQAVTSPQPAQQPQAQVIAQQPVQQQQQAQQQQQQQQQQQAQQVQQQMQQQQALQTQAQLLAAAQLQALQLAQAAQAQQTPATGTTATSPAGNAAPAKSSGGGGGGSDSGGGGGGEAAPSKPAAPQTDEEKVADIVSQRETDTAVQRYAPATATPELPPQSDVEVFEGYGLGLINYVSNSLFGITFNSVNYFYDYIIPVVVIVAIMVLLKSRKNDSNIHRSKKRR